MNDNILDVKNLNTCFHNKDGDIRAVNGISYTLKKGEAFAIVGESGSGKSVSVTSVMGLIKPGKQVSVSGEAFFKGRDLFTLSEKERRFIRGNEMSMIFQDPMSSLNPTMQIGQQIIEPLLWHGKMGKAEAKELGIALLEDVGIPSPAQRYKSYPFEFSGGMRQRAMIAMALICNPDLLIADEPTTALDVTVQAQILNVIREMQKKKNTSVILITHDLAVASSFCDKIIVMYAGKIMESAGMSQFIKNPAHPYSIGLLNSIPSIGEIRDRLHAIPGQPPNLKNVPAGCPFSVRCSSCMDVCNTVPPETEIEPGHFVSCWLCADKKSTSEATVCEGGSGL